MTYQPPVRDHLFLLRDVLEIEKHANLPGFADASMDLVEQILDQAAKFTSEVLAGVSTPKGPVWFVSGKSAGAHRLARVETTASGLKAKPMAELPAGEVASTAYDPSTRELYVAQDNGARLTRIDASGKAKDFDLPAPSCDGGKAGGKRTASLATLDGRVHLAVTAGNCVNVWRF